MPLTSITGGETNLAELLASGHICEMDNSLTVGVQVSVHRAVLAGDGSLINCGTFLAYYTTAGKVISTDIDVQALIKIINTVMQIEYGHLEGCFEEDKNSHCVIRKLERLECSGDPVCNEMDCPLLEFSENYGIIPSSVTIAPVSIVHKCDAECKFITGKKQTVEREEFVNKRLLNYVHNYRNFYFCLNIYCMKCVM